MPPSAGKHASTTGANVPQMQHQRFGRQIRHQQHRLRWRLWFGADGVQCIADRGPVPFIFLLRGLACGLPCVQIVDEGVDAAPRVPVSIFLRSGRLARARFDPPLFCARRFRQRCRIGRSTAGAHCPAIPRPGVPGRRALRRLGPIARTWRPVLASASGLPRPAPAARPVRAWGMRARAATVGTMAASGQAWRRIARRPRVRLRRRQTGSRCACRTKHAAQRGLHLGRGQSGVAGGHRHAVGDLAHGQIADARKPYQTEHLLVQRGVALPRAGAGNATDRVPQRRFGIVSASCWAGVRDVTRDVATRQA